MAQQPDDWKEYQEYLEQARRQFKALENGSNELLFRPKTSTFSWFKEHQELVALLIIIVLLVNLLVLIPIVTRQMGGIVSNRDDFSRFPDDTSDASMPEWRTLFRIGDSSSTLPHYILDDTLNSSKELPVSDVPLVSWLLINEELFMEQKVDGYDSLVLLTTYLKRYGLTWNDLETRDFSTRTIATLANMSTEELAWLTFTINTILIRRSVPNIMIEYFDESNNTVRTTIQLKELLRNLQSYLQTSRIVLESNHALVLDMPASSATNDSILNLSARTQLLLTWLFLDTSRALDQTPFNSVVRKLMNAIFSFFSTKLGPQNNYEAILVELNLINGTETRSSSNESLVFDQLLTYYLTNRLWSITGEDNYLEHRVQAGDFLLNAFMTNEYSVYSRLILDSLKPATLEYSTHDQLWAVIFYYLTGQHGVAINIRANLMDNAYDDSNGLLKQCFSCNDSGYNLLDQILVYFTDPDNSTLLITPTIAEREVITTVSNIHGEELMEGGAATGFDLFSSFLMPILVIAFLIVYKKKRKLNKK